MPDFVIVKNAARFAVYVATNIVPVIHQTAATILPKVQRSGDENGGDGENVATDDGGDCDDDNNPK